MYDRATIAIVGAACRYPGADDPDQLWESVLSRRRSFRPIPPARLNLADYTGDRDGTYARFAAVLEGWTFDRARFRIPGPVHRVTDTAHWLALEVAADALASAGYADGAGLDGNRVGVVVGNTMNGEFSRANGLRLRWPYVRRVMQQALTEEGWEAPELARFLATVEHRFKQPFPEPNDESLAGGLANTIAGRICNHFDFHGGGYTVDGACASSLLSVVTAGNTLRAGAADVVIAGGVDLSLDPFELVGFARTGAIATDAMRIYDDHPTGFWPGEGCGMVVLMRAEDALAEGRAPLALIRDWGVSSDGRGGITRPEQAGQLLAVGRAYEHLDYGPEDVALFEGHGTGTAVGDAVEIATLIEAQRGRRTTTPAALGSIKANIGHTKAAAGLAGLLKAAMALHRQVLPPTTGCDTPHPGLRADDAPLRVLADAEPWPQDQPLRAGVSAMGFGGINTHVVLESAATIRRAALTPRERLLAHRPPSHELVLLGADSRDELRRTLDRIVATASTMAFGELADLAASHLPGERPAFRAALVAADPAQLGERARRAVAALDDGFTVFPGGAVGEGPAGRAGYLFTGQGAGVPAGPGALGGFDPELAAYFDGLSDTVDTAVVQPGVVRASMAGLRWLSSLGVTAHAATGHSLGEITALHWAGALTEAQAVELAAVRGKIMKTHGTPGTGMVSVMADRSLADALIAGTRLVVAAEHGTSHVVAGPDEDLAALMTRCRDRGVTARELRVSHAFHSPAFTEARPVLAEHLRDLVFGAVSRPVYSTVLGARPTPETDLRDLLTEQLTAPVRFADAVSALAEDCDLLVEIGPGRSLTSLATALTPLPVVAMDVGSPSAAAPLQAVAALFALGLVTDPRPIFAHRSHRPFDLWREPRFLENPCEQAPQVEAGYEPLVTEAVPEVRTTSDDVPGTVRELVAGLLELPVEAVGQDDRLLSDLHLNSLRVVQLAGEAATVLGRAVPAEPLMSADVSVAELAALIAALPAADETEPPLEGVASWHRLLVEDTEPVELASAARPHAWRISGRGPLREALSLRAGSAAELVFLPEDPSDDDVATLVSAVRTGSPVTVVDHGDSASGFLASVRAEHPGRWLRWIRARDAESVATVLAAPFEGPVEVHAENGVSVPVFRPAPAGTGEPPLASEDVVLVTGGGKGIGFRSALALGTAYGCRLLLLGRAGPSSDEELRGNLAVLAENGIRYAYLRADLADPAAVRRAIDEPVTAIIHSGGVNEPKRFAELTDDDLARHAAAKYHGLKNVLAAIDVARLRHLVTFGSVIGRFGLPGEAHYALANGRMRELARVLALQAPGCRVRNVDWTAWSGAGMGERLDVLDGLRRSGVDPLPAERGVELLHEVLTSDGPTLLATGRLPQLDRPGDVAGPLLTRTRLHVPGVELVAEADLGLDIHPRLRDHLIDGIAVLPAVVALEIMAEAAATLTGRRVTSLGEARFDRPVIVPADGVRTVRVCALTGPDGVRVVLRSDESGYAADHFTAVAGVPPDPVEPLRRVSALPPHDGADLYGPTFFHGPAFQRVRRYDHLEATACVAVVDAATRWSLDGTQLGDPTFTDATIHALQACVPGRRLLPVGCQAITVHEAGPYPAELRLSAVERHQDGAEHVYDVSVHHADGRPVLSWSRLRLRDIGPLEPRDGWPAVLLGPLLERGLESLLPDVSVKVETGPGLDLEVTGAASLGCAIDHVALDAEEPPGEPHPITRLTGEPAACTHARLRTARSCLDSAGDTGGVPLTVSGVYEQGWVLLRGGPHRIASAIVRISGEPRPVAVAVLVKGTP
ncbi:type I polyketide synthase [Herbidospora yilanensis]|uniref:type I polyketide synthase n=1 Tax=Herbidospora yilanensis TaxID=354426 RepID=UPI00078188CF|nr:type I polyketide synthase [Herbidospora yilanensis]